MMSADTTSQIQLQSEHACHYGGIEAGTSHVFTATQSNTETDMERS